jgi:hypothetical protein
MLDVLSCQQRLFLSASLTAGRADSHHYGGRNSPIYKSDMDPNINGGHTQFFLTTPTLLLNVRLYPKSQCTCSREPAARTLHTSSRILIDGQRRWHAQNLHRGDVEGTNGLRIIERRCSGPALVQDQPQSQQHSKTDTEIERTKSSQKPPRLLSLISGLGSHNGWKMVVPT